MAGGRKWFVVTTINGRWDTGQIAIRVDLIEARGRSCRSSTNFRACRIILAAWHQIWLLTKARPFKFPYVICLANGCVAGSVGDGELDS